MEFDLARIAQQISKVSVGLVVVAPQSARTDGDLHICFWFAVRRKSANG